MNQEQMKENWEDRLNKLSDTPATGSTLQSMFVSVKDLKTFIEAEIDNAYEQGRKAGYEISGSERHYE